RSMPRPVEALPCGSRSTIKTCSPMAASAVPRLIAVVVLPTPPFWLATAMTRGPGASPPSAGWRNGTTCGAASGAGAAAVWSGVPVGSLVSVMGFQLSIESRTLSVTRTRPPRPGYPSPSVARRRRATRHPEEPSHSDGLEGSSHSPPSSFEARRQRGSHLRTTAGRRRPIRSPKSASGLYLGLKSLKSPDHHDAAFGTRPARHRFGLDPPIFSGLGQFRRYILALGEQPDRAPRDQRKRLIAERFQRRQGSCADHVDVVPKAVPTILDSLRMDHRRRPGRADRLAQKRGLLAIALHQVHLRPRPVGQNAGDGNSRKAAAGAEVDPRLRARHEIDELQRVGDVARPQLRNRRRRNQVRRLLPLQKEPDELFQPRFRFT